MNKRVNRDQSYRFSLETSNRRSYGVASQIQSADQTNTFEKHFIPDRGLQLKYFSEPRRTRFVPAVQEETLSDITLSLPWGVEGVEMLDKFHFNSSAEETSSRRWAGAGCYFGDRKILQPRFCFCTWTEPDSGGKSERSGGKVVTKRSPLRRYCVGHRGRGKV